MATLLELKNKIEAGAKIRRKSNYVKNSYISIKGNIMSTFSNENGLPHVFTTNDLFADDWEEYKDNHTDYDKYIGCLCKFFNTDSDTRTIYYGILTKVIVTINGVIYISHNNCSYNFCKPIKSDEVKFYEDVKNENN